MEELQDAIEDAQYMNAMHDDVPRPTKAWKKISAEELRAIEETMRSQNAKCLELDGICEGSLGLYLFMRYVREQGDKRYSNFLLDVATYRVKFASTHLMENAKKIFADYLDVGSLGNKELPEKRPGSLVRILGVVKMSMIANKRSRSSFSVASNANVASSVESAANSIPGSIVGSPGTPGITPTVGLELQNRTESKADIVRRNSVEGAPTSDKMVNMNGSLTGGNLLQSSSAAPSMAGGVLKKDGSEATVVLSDRESSVLGDIISDVVTKGGNLNLINAWQNYLTPMGLIFDVANTSLKSSRSSRSGRGKVAEEEPPPPPGSNYLGVSGEPILRLRTILSHMATAISNLKANKSYKSLPTRYLYIFDEVDQIVFSYLKYKYAQGFKQSTYWPKYIEMMYNSEKKVNEEDFSLFRVLGRGGFGLVNGCKRCQTGRLFAMKAMNKKRVKLKKAESLCLNERNILTIIDSPYVVCLKYAFTTSTDLYLILDLMTGGDLGFHLGRKGKFSDREAKYFASRTVLGIAALHEQSIVFRDLKPENILMDEEGRTRISDLGLACRVGKSGLTGTCGTRGYWAPEMLRRDAAGKRERYTVTVDWFSLGCVIFEFMYGVSPFRTDRARHWGDFPKIEKADKDKAIDLAIKEMDPEFDESFSHTSKDLLRKLLNKDPKKRLGANGVTEIMSHSWFADVDWDNLNNMAPPMTPAKDINMASQSEIGAFADEKTAKKLELTDADHKTFEKWDFISPKAFQEEIVDFMMQEEILGPIKPMTASTICCSIS